MCFRSNEISPKAVQYTNRQVNLTSAQDRPDNKFEIRVRLGCHGFRRRKPVCFVSII